MKQVRQDLRRKAVSAVRINVQLHLLQLQRRNVWWSERPAGRSCHDSPLARRVMARAGWAQTNKGGL